MGNLKGFEKGFINSKVATHRVLSDSHSGNIGTGTFGSNTNKINIGLASNTKAAVNPTSDLDDNPRAGQAPQANGDDSMHPSSKGGASGDGPTPNYNGYGAGVAELNGSHGNDASRKLNY